MMKTLTRNILSFISVISKNRTEYILSDSSVSFNTYFSLNTMSEAKDIKEYFEIAKELTLKAGEVNKK